MKRRSKLIGSALIVFGIVLGPLVLAWSLVFGVPGGALMAPELAPRLVNSERKAGDPVPLSDLPDNLRLQVLAQEKVEGDKRAKPVVALIVLAVSLGSLGSGILTLFLAARERGTKFPETDALETGGERRHKREVGVELKDFVRQSLLEIVEALREANTSYKKSRNAEDNAFLLFPGGDKEKGTGIHFDLAVTTKTETGTAGQAGVNIQVLELSTGGQSQQIKENASRISFTVIIGHYVG